MNHLLVNSVSSSTKQVYKRAWALCNECMTLLGFHKITLDSLPLKAYTILLLLSFLHWKGLAPSTITTYLSAIGYMHKALNVVNPTTNFLVQKVLSSINKIHGSSDSRLPITRFILHRVIDSVSIVVSNLYNSKLLKSMFLIAFYGLFRVGEITVQKSGEISLYLDQIQIFKDRFILTISKFKNNRMNRPFDIIIHKQGGEYCPYISLIDYLSCRGFSQGPVFRFIDGAPVSRSYFTTKLRNCISFCGLDPKRFKSHSFRIGSASHLTSLGKSDLQIKLLGRWNSDSFLRYIRNQKFDIFNHS